MFQYSVVYLQIGTVALKSLLSIGICYRLNWNLLILIGSLPVFMPLLILSYKQHNFLCWCQVSEDQFWSES